MTSTAAILEFLIIGSMWSSLGLIVAAMIVPVDNWWRPEILSKWGGTLLIPLMILPISYVIGIITQSVTWRLWYMPRVHRPDLESEVNGFRKAQYNSVYQRMRERQHLFLGLEGKPEKLESGESLGAFLDSLRWELFRSNSQELARQYLLQFHLYRISYGTIPPLIGFSLYFLACSIKSLIVGQYLPSGLWITT